MALKTNEREGTRAVLRHFNMSASKARVVLDLIRDKNVFTAQEILASTPREAAGVIAKVLASAIANATNNDGLAAEELYVASAYADEGPTLKRFKPRARGRAGRIRKRTCHITIIVARMDEALIARARASRNADGASRSRRVTESRRRADQQSHARHREVAREDAAAAEAAAAEEEAAQAAAAEAEAAEAVEDGTELVDEGHAARAEATDAGADELETPTTDEAPAAPDAAGTNAAEDAAKKETED